jgi:hypothetical protein
MAMWMISSGLPGATVSFLRLDVAELGARTAGGTEYGVGTGLVFTITRTSRSTLLLLQPKYLR